MSPAAIFLSVEEETGEGSYRFMCPTCLDPVEKPADRKIVALLVSAGVDLSDGDAGADHLISPRPLHPESRHSGPAFSADDLIDFHFLLEDDDRLGQALRSS